MKMTKTEMLKKLERIERERASSKHVEIEFIDYEGKDVIKRVKLHNKPKGTAVLRVIL